MVNVLYLALQPKFAYSYVHSEPDRYKMRITEYNAAPSSLVCGRNYANYC